MRVEVRIPLPDGWDVGPETRFSCVGATVRDPATGEIGEVIDGRLNWRDGGVELVATLEIEDAKVERTLSRGSTRGVSF